MHERDGISPENAIMQLEVIEAMYGIAILNKEEVAHWIADMARDRKEALAITTILNTRIATGMGGGMSGELLVPRGLLEQILVDLRRLHRKRPGKPL